MSNFVTIDEDKFEKKTTYQNSKHLNLDTDGGASICDGKISFRRIVVMPDQDCLLMDLDIEASGSNWSNLNRGKIILLIDGETVTLNNPVENYHDSEVLDDGSSYYKESCYFEIGKDLLKRICDSKSFAMQIYVDAGRTEVENVNAVVVYSKLFYNAVYDNTAYTDVVTNALGEFTRSNADLSSFSKIALDGSGANGGCMGMFALLITLAGAAIGGICALV
jgi:hypothetical protein